jgi:hypothetical protein
VPPVLIQLPTTMNLKKRVRMTVVKESEKEIVLMVRIMMMMVI